jgi:hypothetical protein
MLNVTYKPFMLSVVVHFLSIEPKMPLGFISFAFVHEK